MNHKPDYYEFNPPSLPPELKRGNGWQTQERQELRVMIMQVKYGCKFSPATKNILGIIEGKKLGIPGIGSPNVIYSDKDETIVPVDDCVKV